MKHTEPLFLNDPQIIVALDYDNQQEVISLTKQLDPELCRLKIGKELFTACGPDIVKRVQDLGFEVFLDLKFHDIPATVAKACATAANLGIWMLNVHALGGSDMLKAARVAIDESKNSPLLIAVTILTSFDQRQLDEIGVDTQIDEQVLRLAELSNDAGLDGVVCSAREAQIIRAKLNREFLLVTPGIRPAGSQHDDQKRIMTPKMALDNGSNYLVIGRPITQAKNPLDCLQDVFTQISHY